MENTERIWILYVTVLSLNCLIAGEVATVAKRHLIINAIGLIYDIYFENALTSKLKSIDRLLWRRDLLLFPHEMKVCEFILG